jgi:hypothetical protein
MQAPQKHPVLDSDGLVVNVILHHGTWTPPDGHVLGQEGGEIGDWWDGEKYVCMDRRAKIPRSAQAPLQMQAPMRSYAEPVSAEPPLPVIPDPEPLDDEEAWEAPAFLRRDPEPMPEPVAVAEPMPPVIPMPEQAPVNSDLMQAAIEEATVLAIDRIAVATDKAAAHLAEILTIKAQTPAIPAQPTAITDPRDISEDQVLYETAMRAINGTFEAIQLLSEPAKALGISVTDLANKIIEDRKARERSIMAAYAARLGG